MPRPLPSARSAALISRGPPAATREDLRLDHPSFFWNATEGAFRGLHDERSCSLLPDIRDQPTAPTRLPARSHRSGSTQASITSFVDCGRAHPTIRSESFGSARVVLKGDARALSRDADFPRVVRAKNSNVSTSRVLSILQARSHFQCVASVMKNQKCA